MVTDDRMYLKIKPPNRKGLVALQDFSHLILLYWADQAEEPDYRNVVFIDQQMYRHAPEQMGVFATRSAYWPNPILSYTVKPLKIDWQQGIIDLSYIDTLNGTPLLDIKPYTPSIDRVATYQSPDWCSH